MPANKFATLRAYLPSAFDASNSQKNVNYTIVPPSVGKGGAQQLEFETSNLQWREENNF